MGKIINIAAGMWMLATMGMTPAMAQGATAEFKLGIMSPYTGPAAQTGTEIKNGASMAFDAIHWQIGKYKIVPVWIDEQSDPSKATNAYEQAVVQNHIQAGLLNWHSSVAVAVMEVTAKYKIPHLLGTGSTELVNEKFNSNRAKYDHWMIKSWPIPTKLSVAYVQAIDAAVKAGTYKPKNKTVAIYAEDTDLGRTVGNGFRDQFTRAGWKIVAQEYFPISQTDFYPLLNKFKALHPDVVAGTSTAAPALSAFIKQADEVGLNSLIIADGLGWFGDWYKLTGISSDYVLDEIPAWGSGSGKAFAASYKTKFGYVPSPSTAGIGFDSANFFIKMAKEITAKGGQLTSDSIYNFVKNNVWTGKWTYKDGIVMKEYKYTKETIPDPVVGPSMYTFPVLQYHAGNGKIIFPMDWAESKLQTKP
jgi:branched-chain amino acid transport system substrate-binding protein